MPKHYLETEEEDILEGYDHYSFGPLPIRLPEPSIIQEVEEVIEPEPLPPEPQVIEKIIEKIVAVRMEREKTDFNQDALLDKQVELNKELIEAIKGIKIEVDLPDREYTEEVKNLLQRTTANPVVTAPSKPTAPSKGMKITKLVRDTQGNITVGTEFEILR